MKILSVVCAENIIRDVETGNLTAYNIIDDVTAAGFPFLFPRFSLYIFSEKEQGDDESMTIELSIYNNDQKLFQQPLPINFNYKPRNRGILKFNGVAIGAPGFLIIKINLANEGASLYEKRISLSPNQNIVTSAVESST